MASHEKLVYGLTDPRTGGIRYVGRSSTGLARPRAHFKALESETDLSHRVRWLRVLQRLGLSYGIIILEHCRNKDHLYEAEERWILAGRRLGWELTNSTAGGKDGPLSLTPEHRAKIAAAARGRPRPDLKGKPNPAVAARNRDPDIREMRRRQALSRERDSVTGRWVAR